MKSTPDQASTPTPNDSDILSTANRLLFRRCPQGTQADLFTAADCALEALGAHGRTQDTDVALRLAGAMVDYHAGANHRRWLNRQRRRAFHRWGGPHRNGIRSKQLQHRLEQARTWRIAGKGPAFLTWFLGCSLRTAQRLYAAATFRVRKAPVVTAPRSGWASHPTEATRTHSLSSGSDAMTPACLPLGP